MRFWFLAISLIFHFNGNSRENVIFEAEQAVLCGTAVIVPCTSASGGQMVKGLDNSESNALEFQNIAISEAGNYFIRISYFAVTGRKLTWKTNGGSEEFANVPASGLWCYQGGVPADYTFQVSFNEGNNSLLFYNSPIIDKITVLSDTTARKAAAFYLSSVSGNDSNDGLSENTPWKTIEKVNAMEMLPGDSILFHSDETFAGKLVLQYEGGSAQHPIIISSYGEGMHPVLDGDGNLSTIHIINSGYIHFSKLEITNDGGPAKLGVSEDLRYGLYLENTHADGTVFEHYRLNNVTFKNIYPTTQITDDDQTGVNAYAITTSGSWGDNLHPTRFRDLQIENCLFTRTARHAAVFNSTDSLNIRNNLFEHVGGAGMVIGNNCTNILVERNVTNYTGSKIDSRMASRGSGIWCYRTKNLTVQHNKFMHARGIHDSYGMHIDIGNRNVVYQYNYSEDNEGGFAEILGANLNVGYRFNLSVGDGWRKRGNRFGQIFWLAGWSGDPKNPIGSDSIFIYNNSIYVRDSISPGIWIEEVSKNARIYNNIIDVAGKFGPVVIKNNSDYNDFDYNLWHGDIPETDEDGETYHGINAITADPLFVDVIVTDSSGFVLQPNSPVIGKGKFIFNADFSGPFDGFCSHGGRDYFGNELASAEVLSVGAYNGISAVGAYFQTEYKNEFVLYPNPVKQNQTIKIELRQPLITEGFKIQIIDLWGKTVVGKSVSGTNTILLKTDQFKRGSYMVRIQKKSGIESRKLLIL